MDGAPPLSSRVARVDTLNKEGGEEREKKEGEQQRSKTFKETGGTKQRTRNKPEDVL